MRPFLAVFAAAVAACSSSNADGPSCDPPGTYEVTPKKVESTCPDAATNEDKYTVTVATDGDAIQVGYGESSVVCRGTVKDCKATVACTTSLAGGGEGTIQTSWTFDAKGLKGSTTHGYDPSFADRCSVEYDETGTKK